jgi:type I restriction enzyme M protein
MEANRARLTGIQKGDRPKALIDELSENLLAAFRVAPLLDAYDVYQHLMDYWAEAMQDDVYMIAGDGWRALQDGKPNIDLIPAALIVTRYFEHDRKAIEKLQAEADDFSRRLDELDEEHSGEDSLLADARTDKNKLTAKSVKDRLKAIKQGEDAVDERKLLELLLDVMESEATITRKVKDAQKALDAKVAAQYSKLTEAEIRTLVVDDKWLARLAADVQSELDRVSQALTGRIRELAERYAEPLPQLTYDAATLASRVDEHIRKMGFVC